MEKQRFLDPVQTVDFHAVSPTEIEDILYHAHDSLLPRFDPQEVREALANGHKIVRSSFPFIIETP